jgi:MFS family permease
MGHEIPTAILPSFLVTALGAPAAALGLIEGLANGAAGIARLVGGALADDPGRRRSVAAGGYVGTAVLAALIGVATTAWQAGLFRAAAWVSRGLRVPPRNALLADTTTPVGYGRAYGFERAMDNVGAIAGPLLALGLVAAVGARPAMVISVIPGLMAALAIAYAIRSIPRPMKREHQPLRLQLGSVLRGGLGRLMLGVTAFEAGNAAATLLILRASVVLGSASSPAAGTRLGIALYVVYNTVAALASFPAGRAGDRWGPLKVLTAGVALFLVAYLGFAVGRPTVAWFGLSFLAAGLGIGFVETAQHAAVALLAPVDVRGSAFGVLAGIQGFGNLAASAIAGLLWSMFSGRAAFVYLAAWMALALVAIIAAGGSTRQSKRGVAA